MDLPSIQKLTQDYASAHAEYLALTKAVDAFVADFTAQYGAKFRTCERKLRERHHTLAEAIRSAPELFTKPRTMTYAGVKVGLAKGRGGIQYGDPDDVVRRIEKVYGEEAVQYLHIRKCPDKEAIEKLSVAELRRIGCDSVEAGDKVVIAPLDGDASAQAKQFLKSLAEEETTA